jgi:hypothetical protein
MNESVGRLQGTDYFRLADQLTRTELDYLRRTRGFVDDGVLAVINGYWERAELPWPLVSSSASPAWSATGSLAAAARRGP